MRRGVPLMVAAALGLACWSSTGLARPRLQRAAAQLHAAQLHFTHWTVHATGGGASVQQQVRPGGSFRICSSSKLTELDAHYRSGLPSGTSVHTVWKVTGQAANSEPGKAFPKGYFYIASPHGLPDGTWSLKIVRKGREIASSSVKISREHC